MSRHLFNIWGREFELNVEFNCYKEDESDVTDVQKEAKKRLLDNPSMFNQALEGVKEYCLRNDKDKIGTSTIENIFKYVKPQIIAIANNRDGHRVVALMCAYKFDIDLGIAVVFQDEELREVEDQDVYL